MDRTIVMEVGALAYARLLLVEDGYDPARLAEKLLRDHAERNDRNGSEQDLAALGLLGSAPPDDEQSDADRADLAEARCVLAMPQLKALCEQRQVRLGIGPGWVQIVSEAVQSIWAIDPGAAIIQVKQKFGDLDINFGRGSVSDPGQDRLIADVEAGARREASETCELCGLTGSLRSNRPYVETLCDTHALRTS